MRLIGKKHLEKVRRKNKGNVFLEKEIGKLINQIEQNEWKNQTELKEARSDADCVHSDGFYFFNIGTYRTMILIEFMLNGEATVVWAGNHREYESIFKNNKKVIKKWLRSNNWI